MISSSSPKGSSSIWTSPSRGSSMSTGPQVSIVRNECDNEDMTEIGKKK
uniref:Uncharacterized protein n=1 Tax=Nelumbo nucifera TaxID=4432 RepID=A0A822XN40_NELNU|nr:TPA_asm: hypothetical protein HUJ06_022925 [Nelumbo nucifera]